MNYFFKTLSAILILFLLLKCGEPSPPVYFTAAQTERLLEADSAKVWRKTGVIHKESGTTLCQDSVVWIFFQKRDSLAISGAEEGNCNLNEEYDYARYIVQNKDNIYYLKFYQYGVSKEDTVKKDTLTRIITSITDKQFTTEIKMNDSTLIEDFEVQ